jgi:hypothetical protein
MTPGGRAHPNAASTFYPTEVTSAVDAVDGSSTRLMPPARVCSVNSNLTGCPVFFCRTVARSTAYPPGATFSTLRAATSQPRNLLSIARLNIAKSRVLPLNF